MKALPLVSCIMPTANRRAFVPRAIEYFLRQDYPEKELVILDDGEDSVADLIPPDPRIRYLRETRRRSVGAKRNALCEAAQGELIAHWDDDDWYPPNRLRRQVEALGANRDVADVCGSSHLFFLDSESDRAWEYRYEGSQRPYLLGSTLVYRRDLWRRAPFPDRQVGEDAAFLWSATTKRTLDLADPGLAVATVHSGNTSPKRPLGAWWHPTDAAALHCLIGPKEAVSMNALAEQLEPAPEVKQRLPGLTVVVPHMGSRRLPQLCASFANLTQCVGVDELILVELGTEAQARALAGRWGARYVFVRCEGPFERARALNVGTALASYEWVMWKDNDLLMPPGFVARARAELDRLGLDFFIPYAQIHYLAEGDSVQVMRGTRDPADCAPAEVWRGGVSSGGAGIVRTAFFERFGGLDEGFRDWGYEDTAWWYKARLLGRTGITGDAGQVLYHLYHERSDYDPERFRANQALCRQMQAIGSAEAFLARFPPLPHASCPWPLDRRILVVAESAQGASAQAMAAALHGTYGVPCSTHLCAPGTETEGLLAEGAEPDALLVFGERLADRLLGDSGPQHANVSALAARTLVLIDPQDEATGEASGPTAGSVPRRCRLPGTRAGEVQPRQRALACVGPLSELLGDPGRPVPRGPLKVWAYWEGACPPWIGACLRTLRTHAPELVVLDRAAFEALRVHDADIDLSRLQAAHRADFIRAYLLAHFGGLWLDADCLLMQPLTEVFERLAAVDFVAHRDRQGWFPNGFMAARPGSRIARALYACVCERLRSGASLGWTSLGGEPLTRILRATAVPWYELKCERVQPVCWSAPEEFFVRRTEAEHGARLDTAALCYMLSNTEVGKYLERHPGEDLLADGTFFRFLLARSVGEGGQAVTVAPERLSSSLVPFVGEVLDATHPVRVLQIGADSSLWGALVQDWWRERDVGGYLAALRVGDEGRDARGLDLYDRIDEGDWLPPSRADDGRWCLILLTAAASRLPAVRFVPLLERAMDAGAYCLIAAEVDIWDPGLGSLGETVVRLGADTARGSVGVLLSRDDPRGVRQPSQAAEVFERWFQEASARGDESVSGPGSSLVQTAELSQRLPLLVEYLGVRSLLDAPCGDFHWMQHVRLGIEEYVGVDVVPELIARNRERHAAPQRRFEQRDLLHDPLPKADLILCRDCLVHFSFSDIGRILRNFRRSGGSHLLTTTFPRASSNADIQTGEWRPLNLEQAPFHFSPPLALIAEKCTEAGGRYADKSLGLWRLRDVRC